jgi:hypothetical protein
MQTHLSPSFHVAPRTLGYGPGALLRLISGGAAGSIDEAGYRSVSGQ